MSTTKASGRLAAGLALVLALVLGACGGGGDDGDGDDGGSGSAAASSTTGVAEDGEGGDDAEGDGESNDASASGDACRLITKGEAEALTGKALDDGVASASESPVGDVGSCVYKILENGRVTTIVNVAIVGTRVPRDVYDAEMSGETPVQGVGDVASLVQPGILSVFDDGVALSVQVLVDLAPATTDDLVEVAKKALERV